MSGLFWFFVGVGLGNYFTWKYCQSLKTQSKITVHMDAEQAANFIESDEAVKRLKEELKIHNGNHSV